MTDLAHVQITPGVYLRKRREAVGWSLEPAQARLTGLSCSLADIEADRVALTIHDANVIGNFLDVDHDVLADLVAGRPVRLCRICACSEFNPCGSPGDGYCFWAEFDCCSSCAPESARSVAA